MLAEKDVRTVVEERDPHKPELARIVASEPMIEDHMFYRLRFENDELNRNFAHRPGQFVMLSVLGTGEAPFSISSSPTRPGNIELGIRRAGRVTDALFKLREDSLVGLRGPYGNGFPVEDMRGHDVLVVAGGLGLVPLRSLLWYMLDKRQEYGKITLLYGTKSTSDILFRNELEAMQRHRDFECKVIVEKVAEADKASWKGEVGLITALFKNLTADVENTYVTVCGPPVMYKFVLLELLARGFSRDKILMSLERKMKCGIGKCGHCGVGDKYCCVDGPVFTYWDAMNLPEMI